MRSAILPILIFASPALAQAPQPAPEAAAAIKAFGHGWTCTETVKDDQGKDVPITSEWTLKPDASGFWVTGTYEQKPSKEYPGFLAALTYGWDSGVKKYVFQGFDNSGGRLMMTADASDAGTLAWSGEGHLGGQALPARYTWTVKGDKPATATFVLELQIGKDWQKFADGTCKAGNPKGAPASVPKSTPENDALKPFLKSWTCDDQTTAGMGGPPIKVKTTFNFKPMLNGFWWLGAFDQKKQKDFRGFHGDGIVGWDVAQKKYVFVGFDSNGGHINLLADAAGDTIAWTGNAHGNSPPVPFKFTWTKKDDKNAEFVVEVTPPGAPGPVKVSDATCKAGK